jgi:UDP-N-acetylmuramoylalanine--D-glutamate ligase
MKLKDQHILVFGLGESGLAMARWGNRQGAQVRIVDTRPEPPGHRDLQRLAPDVECLCMPMDEGFDTRLLDRVDLLALSPGIDARMPALVKARQADIPVVGEIELFSWALNDPRCYVQRPKILAITGTNGKTTTTALTGHLCRAVGLDVGVAGNISPSALTALLDAQDAGRLPDIWVLELSSFQLETVSSLNADAAAVLNLSEDHLDRYADFEAYARAKERIFVGGGAQVLNRQDHRCQAMAKPGRPVVYFGLDVPARTQDFGLRACRGVEWIAQGEKLWCARSTLALAGAHHVANAMSALALCDAIGLALGPVVDALGQFEGLPHRVEKIATIDDVTWYDDSKGTNVGATIAAINGLTTPQSKVVVILGGQGKGQDFSPLKPVLDQARAVILMGCDAPLIHAAIAPNHGEQRGAGDVAIVWARDMDEAVHKAFAYAQPGDAVLLSPACASFDMFRNYAHRGDVFAQTVRALHNGSQRVSS